MGQLCTTLFYQNIKTAYVILIENQTGTITQNVNLSCQADISSDINKIVISTSSTFKVRSKERSRLQQLKYLFEKLEYVKDFNSNYLVSLGTG